MEAVAAISAATAPYAGAISLVGTTITTLATIQSVQAQKQASQLQAQRFAIQAEQAKLQGRQNALNYNNQANQIFERQQQLAATVRARAAAAGVNPLTGSPLSVQEADAIRAGREFQIAKENAEMSLYGGLAASQDLRTASSIAGSFSTTPGTLAAVGTGLMGLAKVGETVTPPKINPTSYNVLVDR
jgi:glycerol-3-phosphate dehydrogenase